MDIISCKPMTYSQVTLAISGQKTVVGAKQIRKALVSGFAGRVYLAADADPALTDPLFALCRQYAVEVAWVRSMYDLGRACAIEVGAAAAATVNFS